MARASEEDQKIMETGETAEVEVDEEPRQEPRPLQDAQVEASIAEAIFRQKRDALIAAWRDWLHYGMQSPGAVNMIHTIHAVMNSMDDFLNHRSRK
jgi:hypothetical protein